MQTLRYAGPAKMTTVQNIKFYTSAYLTTLKCHRLHRLHGESHFSLIVPNMYKWSCLCLRLFSLREGVRPLLRPPRPHQKRRKRRPSRTKLHPGTPFILETQARPMFKFCICCVIHKILQSSLLKKILNCSKFTSKGLESKQQQPK